MRSWCAALPFVAVLACVPEPTAEHYPKNACGADTDCTEDDVCLTELGLCAVKTMREPYSVVLQISPQSTGGAGAINTGALRLDSAQLEALHKDGLALTIPPFVQLEALLTCQGEPMLADVGLYPETQNPGYPTAPIGGHSSASATGEVNLRLQVPPDTSYTALIQPLETASKVCPPFRVTLPVDRVPLKVRPPEPTLETYKAYLVKDVPDPSGEEFPGGESKLQRARVWNRKSNRVVSATIEVQIGSPTPFEINVLSDQISDSVLQVDLDPNTLWHEVIEVPLPALAPTDPFETTYTIRVPEVPKRVTLTGSIVQNGRVPPNSKLLLRSAFPTSMPGGNLDWCQLRRSGGVATSVSCRAERWTYTDDEGRYKVELIPGVYDMVAFPGKVDPRRQEMTPAASARKVTVETQPRGGPLSGNDPLFKDSPVFKGFVEDQFGSPLPGVTIRAQALEIGLDTITGYARSSTIVTNERGRFWFSLDNGYYDLIADPPSGSGYARLYSPNRGLGSAAPKAPVAATLMDRDPIVQLKTPVVVQGSLALASSGEALAGWSIRAYGIVPDRRSIPERARPVLVGSAITDEKGEYVLLLPAHLDTSLE